MLKFIPAKLLGIIVHWFSSISYPKFLVSALCKWFARKYEIDTSILSKKFDEYNSLLDFFIREPGIGIRPICSGKNEIASPVDALITAVGKADSEEIILVKGSNCTINQLVLKNHSEYVNGDYVILYLSPGDFHRIYSPCDGVVSRSWLIAGKLWPVFPNFVEKNPQTFCKNKRVVTELVSEAGKIMIVKVGAMNVGRIPVNHSLPYSSEEQKVYKKGQEIGRFEFGSTVILLFEKGKFKLEPEVSTGTKVKIGQRIGIGC
ncbi:MAG: phosphatidylserine decarboxylase [Chlamydiae bacterium]|nr:MAG: phosphatidylserine decarboxylase [Chlamydiota bacterium]